MTKKYYAEEKWEHDYETTRPLIVERNKDVEHILYASCQYGSHGFGQQNRIKLFAMLATTDIHTSSRQLQSAVDYLNYYEPIDCGICLGDIQACNYAESDGHWYSNIILKSKKEFYTVLGNHDVGNSADIKISATSQMAFDKLIYPLKDKIGIKNLSTPYYLKLFDKYKVALIVLNNYEAEVMGTDGNFAVHRGYECYTQAQIDWLIASLKSIPKTYHLIIAMHSFFYNHETIECSWSQQEACFSINSEIPYGQDDLLTDIVDAWINGTALRKNYQPKDEKLFPTLRVACDFANRGKGNFACYLVGHEHKDIIARSKKYPNQKIVCLGATANDNWQNYCSDLPRAIDSKAEDLLTVLSIEPDKRQIRLVRVGSNITIDMTERTYIVIQY